MDEPEGFRGGWARYGGRDTDLRRLTGEYVAWMSTLPAVALVDRHLLVHSDSARYLEFGSSVAAVNAAIRAALEAGYRHIDTATSYHNEAEVGAGLADSGVGRDQVFVTTKCPPRNVGRAIETLRQSLDGLRTDHVDLWLVHWPGGDRADVELWREFVQARREGLARDIGVSNYSLDQLDELTKETGETPAVNQVEWSPLLFDRAVLGGHRGRRGLRAPARGRADLPGPAPGQLGSQPQDRDFGPRGSAARDKG